jgi:hypothetical protein
MQIFLADLVIGANDATLENRPEALNRIGVNRANDMPANGVIDGLVREVSIKPLIARTGDTLAPGGLEDCRYRRAKG